MIDQNIPPEPSRPDSVTEAEMDRQRLGGGLGGTVDGVNVADMGHPGPEPRRVAGGAPGAPPPGSGAEDAGDLEDLGPDEAGPDGIEAQDTTHSGSSGL